MLRRVGAAASSAHALYIRRPGVTSRALSGAKVRSRPEARGGFPVRGDTASATQTLSRLMESMLIAASGAAISLSAAQLIGAARSRCVLHSADSLY